VACYALRMQAQMLALGDELQRSLGLPLQIRVGLNPAKWRAPSAAISVHLHRGGPDRAPGRAHGT
jgi:hypothetical protein